MSGNWLDFSDLVWTCFEMVGYQYNWVFLFFSLVVRLMHFEDYTLRTCLGCALPGSMSTRQPSQPQASEIRRLGASGVLGKAAWDTIKQPLIVGPNG